MDEIIKLLTEIIENDDFDEKYLIKFKEMYEISTDRYNQICDVCKELETRVLPYDCLSKPSYCVKNEKDKKLILLYEKLKFGIEHRDYI